MSSSLSQPPARALSLTSAEVKEDVTIRDERVLNAFNCTGDNLSPTPGWKGVSATGLPKLGKEQVRCKGG